VRWLASRADHVVAGNDILAEYLHRDAERITVVPSLADTDNTALRVHAESDHTVVGWIGSRSTARFLKRLGQLLYQVSLDLKPRSIELIAVGGSAPAIRGVKTRSIPWSKAAEREVLQHIDIGVMPLPDTPWTRGKCAYKAIQYMAAGVPVVADDVGITREVVGDGGLVATSEIEWREAFEALVTSLPLRRRLGIRGRARVEADYSVRRWAPTLAAIWSDG
jgi:glycosyltransferase involved in cell wall biosynthesis